MSKRSGKEVESIVSAMGVFMAIISNLVDLVKKFGGTMENIYRLATPEGSVTLEAVARIIADGIKKEENKFLTLLSVNEALEIDATDGKEILANAKDVFTYIDSDFKNWDADEKGPATDKIPVRVYEMAKDATFAEMFGSLSSDTRKLCLTQNQIIDFVKKHRNWLRADGYATFFLFESSNEFFVVCVNVGSGGSLYVSVYRFESSFVWYAEDRSRVVAPQLA